MRVVRLSTDSKYGHRLPGDSPALSWLPRFAAAAINQLSVGSDGRPHSSGGRARIGSAVQFLERVFFRRIGEDGPSSYASQMTLGHL